MISRLAAFWRLSRPTFLLGGILLFALGAAIARSQGCLIDTARYFLGQLCVTSLQLMTHYLNEYWDIEADRQNRLRTKFSGGSGILPAGLLPPCTAMVAGMVCLMIGGLTAVILVVVNGATPAVWVLLALAFLGSYFYSSPPLRLAARGIGEFVASLVVAGLVPVLALLLFGGTVTARFILVVVPLIATHLAMLLAFEFPDEKSDRLAGKRTLVVRLGRRHAAWLHNGCLFAAMFIGLVGSFTILRLGAVIAFVIIGPLAIWQSSAILAVTHRPHVAYGQLTFTGVAIFALAVALSLLVACFG